MTRVTKQPTTTRSTKTQATARSGKAAKAQQAPARRADAFDHEGRGVDAPLGDGVARGASQAALRVESKMKLSIDPAGIRNPLSWQDCPDPTVMRVGADLYFASTDSTPGRSAYVQGDAAFPLKRARGGDLSKLEDVGHLFPKDGAPQWMAGDLWAPDFYHDENVGFVVTYTARDKQSGELALGIAFADKPEGPYRERTPGPFLRADGHGIIDSHIFRDEKTGKYHFVWKDDLNDDRFKRPTDFHVQELSLGKRPSLEGKRTTIMTNDRAFETNLIEGPAVLQKDGKYFMFYSSGPYYNGDYVTSVARADKPTGPWEKRGEPIIPNDEHFVGRGHGFVLTDDDGRELFACHGYAADRIGPPNPRVLLMYPIAWGKDGWPTIDTATPQVRARE